MGNIQVWHLSRKSSSFLNRKAKKATFSTHSAHSWEYHEPLHGARLIQDSSKSTIECKESPPQEEDQGHYYTIEEPSTPERRLFQDESQEDQHNEAQRYTIRQNKIICSICGFQAESVSESHKHNTYNHKQILSKEEDNITTCVLCLFAHQNTSAVKVHTEIAHNARQQKLFVSHRRGTNVYAALEDQQREELFKESIKQFYYI